MNYYVQLCNEIIILMLETMQNNQFQFNDDNMQARPVSKQELKLPKLDRPTSKNRQLVQRSGTKFPSIKLDARLDTNAQNGDSLSDFSQSSQRNQGQNVYQVATRQIRKKTDNESEQDDFVMEVEKKLKMVLQQQNIIDIQESDDNSAEDDFQRKINQNKQLIKMHKQRKQKETEVHANNFININAHQAVVPLPVNRNKLNSKKHKTSIASNNLVGRNRNESLYEKRAKQYKDPSAQNKYLQKKKQNIAMKISKQNALRQAKQAKSKESIGSNKIMSMKPFEKDKVKNQQKQSSSFCSPQAIKYQQLFDGIQNFLQNPKKSESEAASLKGSYIIKRSRKQLQQKLKLIEQRIKQQSQTDYYNNEHDARASFAYADKSLINKDAQEQIKLRGTIQQWKKVQLSRNSLSHADTNFDKQLQRVNQYFQRNEQSLDKYVSHQKLIVQIDLWKRMKNKSISDKEKTLTTSNDG